MLRPFTVVTVILTLQHLAGAPMSKDDRQHVIAHLEMTESWLADEVAGLSPAQLNFRYAPGKWTILDVVEHLAVAEPGYWTDLQKEVKQPPAKPKQQVSDLDMLWYGIDRTERQKTSPSEEPKGRFTDVQQGMASFRKLRAAMLAYARGASTHIRPCWASQRTPKGTSCRFVKSKPRPAFRRSNSGRDGIVILEP
jgi:hypothetical protein